MKKVLLYGPKVNSNIKGAYGGGTGGYTRKMVLYLNHFRSDKYKMCPCFHTIRGEKVKFGFVGRFFKDLRQFHRCIRSSNPNLVHFLGQYRGAMPREFFLAFFAKFYEIPYIYEIKAGVFVSWYKNTNIFNRIMMNYVLRNAAGLTGQGMPYIEFVKEQFQLPITFYPNFVPAKELIPYRKDRLTTSTANILFVGYAFRDKGVFELVEACNQVVKTNGHSITLTMVGKEHEEFTVWIEQYKFQNGFEINRLGKQPHEKVLEIFQENDIYCYPTRHKGEGHNNTINEALMSAVIIITTKQGFLESIIGSERGYLIEKVATKEIAAAITHILNNKEEARRKAENGRKYLEENFIDEVAFSKLHHLYDKALKHHD